jgi:parallel beta-helix repeat protein
MVKAVSGMVLILLLGGILASDSNIQLSEPSFSTIYIRGDGSVEPATAPIERNGDLYTLAANIRMKLDTDGIVIERDSVTLDGCGYTVAGMGLFSYPKGICLLNTSRVTVKDVNIASFHCGLYLENSTKDSLCGNRLSNNSEGTRLTESSNNTLVQNNMTNNAFGVLFDSSFSNVLVENNISNNSDGILLMYSSNCRVEKNNLTANIHGGLYLADSSNNTLIDNSIMRNGGNGVYLDYSAINSINTNSIVANKGSGIVLWDHSDSNGIVGNNITANEESGIVFSGTGNVFGSSNCNITGNIIAANKREGIKFSESSNNRITGNIIACNALCFDLADSSNNPIYHNSFINNTNGVLISRSTNTLDNGCEGNYWSTYTKGDLDHDGIDDYPFLVGENNVDNHPLMSPYMLGDVNHDGKVSIIDISIFAKVIRTKLGDNNWNPHADLDENSVINTVDIVLAAKEFGKEWIYP